MSAVLGEEATQSSESVEVWRSPRAWAKVMARASVDAKVTRKNGGKIGFPVDVIYNASFFAEERRNHPEDYRLGVPPKYSLAAQLRQMHIVIEYLAPHTDEGTRARWAEEAKRILAS